MQNLNFKKELKKIIHIKILSFPRIFIFQNDNEDGRFEKKKKLQHISS